MSIRPNTITKRKEMPEMQMPKLNFSENKLIASSEDTNNDNFFLKRERKLS